MRPTRSDYLMSELRRLRGNIADAFRDQLEKEEGALRRAPSFGSGHVVRSQLTILDVMEGELETVFPETPVRSALTLMIENRISSVPVVDEEQRIVGALAEKDLMKVFYQPDAACVAAVMNHSPATVSLDAPLVEVVDQLMSSDFRRVLVHEERRLVGVITRSHLMPALLHALEVTPVIREPGSEPH